MSVVFFVPGITGSNLAATFAGISRPVWPDVGTLAAYGPGLLQLADDGVSPGPLATWGPLSPTGIVSLGIYDPMLAKLKALGHTVQTVSYDWRKSLRVEATRVVTIINETSGTEPFFVMCHSMGGLLARFVYAQMGDTPIRQRWRRTVYFGTPHGGSHAAAANMAGWLMDASDMVLIWSIIYPILRNPLNSVFPLPYIPTLILRVMASWPGLYELFPSFLTPWATSDPQAEALFHVEAFHGVPSKNAFTTRARFTDATTTVTQLAGLIGGAAPGQLCVLGTNQPTIQRVADLAKIQAPEGWAIDYPGDGAVSQERGTLPGAMMLHVETDHISYFRQQQLLELIPDLLTGIPPGTVIPAPTQTPPRTPIPPNVSGITKPWQYLQRTGDP